MDKTKITEEDDILDKEFLKGRDLSNQTDYGRPPVPKGINDRTNDITFMQIECDYYTKTDRKSNLELIVWQP